MSTASAPAAAPAAAAPASTPAPGAAKAAEGKAPDAKAGSPGAAADPKAQDSKSGAAADAPEVGKEKDSKDEPLYTIKVAGKEKKVSLGELTRLAQLNENAELTTQQARDLEKKARGVLEAFEKDPRGAVAKALKAAKGQELIDFAVEVLAEAQQKALADEEKKAKDDAMDPRDRRLKELEDKIKQAEDEKAETTKKAREAAVDKAYKEQTGNVISTLDLFPEQWRKHELVANRVVDAWTWAIENQEKLAAAGVQITPKTIHEIVQKNLRGLLKAVSATAQDDELDELIDQSARERLIKKHGAKAVAAAEAPHPALVSEPKVRASETPAEDRPRKTRAELLRG